MRLQSLAPTALSRSYLFEVFGMTKLRIELKMLVLICTVRSIMYDISSFSLYLYCS